MKKSWDFKITMTMSLVCFLVMGLVLVLAEILLSDKELLLDSQPSSIESGFEKSWHISVISSPFFMLAVLFVLFDMELILLLPCVYNSFTSSKLLLHILMVIISLTLALEWSVSGLKWHL